MVAEVLGKDLNSISDVDLFKWGVAWQDEPPLLLQCRDILAAIAMMVGNGLGGNLSMDDFIPKAPTVSDEQQAINDMLIWSAKVNASNGYVN